MEKSETAKRDNHTDVAKQKAESGRSDKLRSRLSWRKKILFALIPVVGLLLVAEATLRIAGYESPVADPFDSFVLRRPLFVGDGETLTTAYPRRSFFHLQSFTRSKPPGTKRIFVFGGSTTYGYALPNPRHDSYVHLLGESLTAKFPGTKFEMINCGGQSYASYRLVDLVDECMDYSPDLVIIMSGHNEFIEARYYSNLKGADSATRRAWYSLRTVRLFAHLSNKLNAKKYDGLDEQKAFIGDNPFVTEKYIVRDEKEFQLTLEHYTRNMNRMVDTCQQHGTPVIVCTCPSNLLDHPPFESEPPKGMSRDEFYNLIEKAFQLFKSEKLDESLAICDGLLKQDSRSAAAHFIAGKCYYALGQFETAKQSLILAKDTDSFPKRALTNFNQRVRDIAQEQGTPLFDGEKLFFEKAEHGIPGKELFSDDCHPTVLGHRLFASGLNQIAAEFFGPAKP